MNREERLTAIQAAITKHVQGGGKLVQGKWQIDTMPRAIGSQESVWVCTDLHECSCALGTVLIGTTASMFLGLPALYESVGAQLPGASVRWINGFLTGFDEPNRPVTNSGMTTNSDGFEGVEDGQAIYHWAIERKYLPWSH